MLRWLVVVPDSAPEQELATVFSDAQAHRLSGLDPVPLGENELSYEVEGPEDLPHRLHTADIVSGVYPSSEITLY